MRHLRQITHGPGPGDAGPSSELELQVRSRGATRIVSADGELVLPTAPRLAATLGEAISDEALDVVVDLSNVSFVDGTGLSVLINAKRRMLRAGGSMRVVAATPQVRRLFETTRLGDDLETFGSLGAALAA